MNKRLVDRTKKSNIKCEHCKHWVAISHPYCMCQILRVCLCKGSKHYRQETDYGTRCKQFEWPEVNNEDQEDSIT